MAERLRKISDHAAGTRVVFLGEQTEIIPQREQVLKKHARIIVTMLQDVIVRQPEAAGEECALPGRQAVDALLGVVAHRQPAVAHQPSVPLPLHLSAVVPCGWLLVSGSGPAAGVPSFVQGWWAVPEQTGHWLLVVSIEEKEPRKGAATPYAPPYTGKTDDFP
jgi:hypothetical protein